MIWGTTIGIRCVEGYGRVPGAVERVECALAKADRFKLGRGSKECLYVVSVVWHLVWHSVAEYGYDSDLFLPEYERVPDVPLLFLFYVSFMNDYI